jgi:hypothetical protein
MAACFLYKRREFIALLGGAGVAGARGAHAAVGDTGGQVPVQPVHKFITSLAALRIV